MIYHHKLDGFICTEKGFFKSTVIWIFPIITIIITKFYAMVISKLLFSQKYNAAILLLCFYQIPLQYLLFQPPSYISALHSHTPMAFTNSQPAWKKDMQESVKNELQSKNVYSICMIITTDYLFGHTQCGWVQIILYCSSRVFKSDKKVML